MAKKKQAHLSLPQKLIDRIIEAQEYEMEKINPTGYIRDYIGQKLDYDELRRKAFEELHKKEFELLDEITAELESIGKKELLKKIYRLLGLDEESITDSETLGNNPLYL